MNAKLLLLMMIMLVAPVSVLAATPDPGHDISSVGPGTALAGTYIFPNNLTVVNLSVVRIFGINASDILLPPWLTAVPTALTPNTLSVNYAKVVNDLNFTSRTGNNHSLAIMSEHWDEMTTDTLLDGSKSSLVASGGVLNYTISTKNGLTGAFNFGGVLYPARVWNVQNATVTLVSGTNSSPATNYVYFYLNSGVPTLATAQSYPSFDHIDVGTFIVGSVVGDGATIYSYSRNRYEIDSFVTRVLQRFEDSGTLYVSGFTIGANSTNLNITTGSFYNGIFKMTSTNAVAVKDGFYFINSTGNFKQGTDYTAFLKYADGTAIGANDRVNIVFGVVATNVTGGVGPTQVRLVAVLQNLPTTGAYTTDATAVADAASATNYYPPNADVKDTFTPIARVVVRPNTGLAVQFNSGLYYQNLAGLVTSGGGAAVAGTSNHAQLSNLAWSVAGHTIDTSVNFGSYDAYGIANLNATTVNANINASRVQNPPWVVGSIPTSYPAANVSAGTFAAGDFTFPANLTVSSNALMATGKKIALNSSDISKNYISSNSSGCVLIAGATVTLAVC